VIASTGAMLTVGHEAPCRISALACRIESRKHTGKEGNSRQASGTSDASKTQLGLTRSWVSRPRRGRDEPQTRLGFVSRIGARLLESYQRLSDTDSFL